MPSFLVQDLSLYGMRYFLLLSAFDVLLTLHLDRRPLLHRLFTRRLDLRSLLHVARNRLASALAATARRLAAPDDAPPTGASPATLRERRLTLHSFPRRTSTVPLTLSAPALVVTPDFDSDAACSTDGSGSETTSLHVRSATSFSTTAPLLLPPLEHPAPRRIDSAIGLLPPTLTAPPRVKHTLFVCTKCDRRSDPVATSACATRPVCAGKSGGNSLCTSLSVPGRMLEMEDMLNPGSPSTSSPCSPSISPVGRKRGKVTSGKRLYRDLVTRHHDPDSPSAAIHATLVIIPVDCLSRCDSSNVVAYAAPGKYTYQFGGIPDGDARTVDELLSFAKDWVESDDRMGYTKGKDRPRGLRATILARIPPLKEVKLGMDADDDATGVPVLFEEPTSLRHSAEDVAMREERMEWVKSWQLGE